MGTRKKKSNINNSSATISEEKTSCIKCSEEIKNGDDALICDLCEKWVCIECTEVHKEIYKVLKKHQNNMKYNCRNCEAEIPKLKQLLAINKEIEAINVRVTEIEGKMETFIQTLDEKNDSIKNIISEELTTLVLSEIKTQMEAQIEVQSTNQQKMNNTYANIVAANTPTQENLKEFINEELTERKDLEAIRLNIVISGIEESNQEGEAAEKQDMEGVKKLIMEELNVNAEIEKVERCGRLLKQTDKWYTGKPRMLKVYMSNQHNRKMILQDAAKIRRSEDEHRRENVYIRPDQTRKQQLDAKNLRDLLRSKKREEPDKVFKIIQGAIKEITV